MESETNEYFFCPNKDSFNEFWNTNPDKFHTSNKMINKRKLPIIDNSSMKCHLIYSDTSVTTTHSSRSISVYKWPSGCRKRWLY